MVQGNCQELSLKILNVDLSNQIFYPWLFMKEGIICVEYVDETIFAGVSGELLEAKMQT